MCGDGQFWSNHQALLDLNADGQVDLLDVAVLAQYLRQIGPAPVEIKSCGPILYLPGDANGDNRIEEQDCELIQGCATNVSDLCAQGNGDINYDNLVDAKDAELCPKNLEGRIKIRIKR